MIRYKREDYDQMANLRRQAFERIAKQLGATHPVTKMMGSRAWGRSNFEQGPDGNLQSAIREMAASDGAFDVMNAWARDNDPVAQRMMLKEYPRGFSSC